MLLEIKLNQSELEIKILQNGKTIDPAPFEDRAPRKNGNLTVLKRCGVDFEKAKYYHDLSKVLTPLEVADIIKNGFIIIKGGTAIYRELLTGLISCLDKLLIRTNIDPVRHFRHNGANRGKKAMSNGVDIKSLKSYKILNNLGKDSSSHKIASAFVEGLKIRF